MPTLSFSRTPLEHRQKIQIAGREGAVKALKNEVAAEKRNIASHVKSERAIDANWRKHVDGLFRGFRKDAVTLQRSIEDKEANYRATIGSPRYDEPSSSFEGPGCQTSGSNRNGYENSDRGYQGGQTAQGGKRIQANKDGGEGGQGFHETEDDRRDKGDKSGQGGWGAN
ncbi:hypothetical protein EAF04_004709 [Stromatinia cepivora]|nr:hypothetical protein EAF04_004709 [Stromatinia cepivora]